MVIPTHIVVTEKIRNNGHQITIDQMIDAFLERLSKALTVQRMKN